MKTFFKNFPILIIIYLLISISGCNNDTGITEVNPVTPADTLFFDNFNNLDKWSVSPTNDSGATYTIDSGRLTVLNWGKMGEHWYGPATVADLNSPLDFNTSDFSLTFFIKVDIRTMPVYNGFCYIALLDEDNNTIAGDYWVDGDIYGFPPRYRTWYHPLVGNTLGYAWWPSGTLGIYYGSEILEDGGGNGLNYIEINGKVTLKKTGNLLQILYNDGSPVITKNISSNKKATKIMVSMQKWSEKYWYPRDMKIDFIRLTKP